MNQGKTYKVEVDVTYQELVGMAFISKGLIIAAPAINDDAFRSMVTKLDKSIELCSEEDVLPQTSLMMKAVDKVTADNHKDFFEFMTILTFLIQKTTQEMATIHSDFIKEFYKSMENEK